MSLNLDGRIAQEARDELPETWDALLRSSKFGEPALVRRSSRILNRLFGRELTNSEQEALDSMVAEYAAKKLALELITPGRDYWDAQVVTLTAGEREVTSYPERAKLLKELGEKLLAETADMYFDIGDLLTPGRIRQRSAPVVAQAGDTVPQYTPDPFDFPSIYGPPDDTTAVGGG